MDEKDCFVLTLYWVCTDFVLDRVLGCVLTLYWVRTDFVLGLYWVCGRAESQLHLDLGH